MIPILNIANEFSKTPGPRFKTWGTYSGEEFREDYLIPWLQKNKDAPKLTIEMDGAISYPPSFLEEAFGGAVRKGFAEQLKKVEFKYGRKDKKELLEKYIRNAETKLSKKPS